MTPRLNITLSESQNGTWEATGSHPGSIISISAYAHMPAEACLDLLRQVKLDTYKPHYAELLKEVTQLKLDNATLMKVIRRSIALLETYRYSDDADRKIIITALLDLLASPG